MVGFTTSHPQEGGGTMATREEQFIHFVIKPSIPKPGPPQATVNKKHLLMLYFLYQNKFHGYFISSECPELLKLYQKDKIVLKTRDSL